MAQIWRWVGGGVGQWLGLQFDPEPGNFHMPGVQPKKNKKKKKKKKGERQYMCVPGSQG